MTSTSEGRTAPPVRLRMVSADMLCARSMEVEWEDGTGVRQRWSSWTDSERHAASWHEAEKLMPASSMDICVQFKVHGLGGPWDVCKVDRQRDRSWVTRNGESIIEAVWLRTGYSGDTKEDIDVVFELCGGMQACYVCRTWNAARGPRIRPDRWEQWEDLETQPRPEARCPTLAAADNAASATMGLGNPQMHCVCTTKRVCAALHALLEVHRRTLQGLRELDAKFTGQWVGANVGNTASAGLGIASAVFLFLAPPVGVGLGIGSAVTGSVAYAGDSLADWHHTADLKNQLSIDARNSFVVAELLKEWVHARQALVSFPADGGGPGDVFDSLSMTRSTLRSVSSDSVSMGGVVDSGLTIGAAIDGAAVAGTRIADQLGRAAAAATQTLGVAGALIQTGFAIRGWSTSKVGQDVVREKITEFSTRVLQIQQLLSSIDRLECPLCAEPIILADTVQRCTHQCHCFHAACIQQLQKDPWSRQGSSSHNGRAARQPQELNGCGFGGGGGGACCSCEKEDNAVRCPECNAPMEAPTDMLVETAGRHEQRRFSRLGRDVVPCAASSHVGASVGGCRSAQEALTAPISIDGRRSGRPRKPKHPPCGIAACFASC